MKSTLLALTTALLLAACSSPKYTYYFDRIPVKSAKPLPNAQPASKNDNANDIASEKSSTETSGVNGENPSAPIQEETLVASSSKEILNQPAKNSSFSDKHSRTSLSKATKTDRKALLKSIKDYKNIKKAFPESVKEGDPSKNVFAVIGFVSIILGLIPIPILSLILLLLGLAFCIVGLKSTQRFLAIAGLIIFSVLIVIGLIALIILSSS